MNVSEIIQAELRAIGADGLCSTEESCGCDITDLQACDSRCMKCIPAKRVRTVDPGEYFEPGDPIYVPIGNAHMYVAAPLHGDLSPNREIDRQGHTRIDSGENSI
jgi:hypothetical protein